MVVLPCLEFFFSGTYLTQIFLIMFGFGLLFALLKEVFQ